MYEKLSQSNLQMYKIEFRNHDSSYVVSQSMLDLYGAVEADRRIGLD